MASCSARKLEPGFAQMYSRPIDLTTSTMQSAPQRSVVSDSVSLSWAGGCAAGAEWPPSDAPPTAAPAVFFRKVRRSTRPSGIRHEPKYVASAFRRTWVVRLKPDATYDQISCYHVSSAASAPA